jgi:hypothetical protein
MKIVLQRVRSASVSVGMSEVFSLFHILKRADVWVRFNGEFCF